MDRFWRDAAPSREPVSQRGYLVAVLVISVLSIPWYWGEGTVSQPIAGLPAWVWITIGCSFGISALTAWTALLHWRDDEDEG